MQNGPLIDKKRQLHYALLALPVSVICYAALIMLLLYAPHTEYAYDLAVKDLERFSLVVPNIITLYLLFLSVLCIHIPASYGKAFAWRMCAISSLLFYLGMIACCTGIDIWIQHHYLLHVESPWYQLLYQHQASWFWYILLLGILPCVEECLFRGFIYYGLSESIFGHGGAIAITAYLWAMPAGYHHPYWMMVNIIYGIILGIARYRTNSIVPPIAMHVLCGIILLASDPSISPFA